MKRMLIIIFLLFSFVFAQTNEIKEALKYYPLHIGDYWQYKVTRNPFGLNDSTFIGYKEVTGDTIMVNNKKYFVVKEDRLSFPYQPFFRPRFIRIDSLTAELYEYDYNGLEHKFDSLLIKKGDKFLGYECKTDTTKEYFGVSSEARLMKQYLISSTGYIGWELAKGFGETMRYYDDIFVYYVHYQCDLIYAKIGGIEFGTKVNIQKSEYLPDQITLFQNYPNPFNPTTTITYEIQQAEKVKIEIFDILGREIEVLLNREQSPGNYKINFDGSKLSSGIYLYKITAGNFVQTKKMMLVK